MEAERNLPSCTLNMLRPQFSSPRTQKLTATPTAATGKRTLHSHIKLYCVFPMNATTRPTRAHPESTCHFVAPFQPPQIILNESVTTQAQLIRNSERGQQEFSLTPHVCIMGGRAFGPPLCRGCAPATPPYKTIPHRPCVRIPAVPLQQPGCRKPNTQSNCLNGGRDKGLVKTDTVDGLVVTRTALCQLANLNKPGAQFPPPH